MTEGRRPAAPGGSTGTGSGAARRRGQRAGAGAHIIDLGTIRRADAILDLLAARRLAWPAARRDPATAVLSLLAADVDGSVVGGTARRLAGAGGSTSRRLAAAGGGAGRTAAAPSAVAGAAVPAAAAVPGRAGRSAAARQRGPAPSRAGGWARPVTSAAAIVGALAAIVLGVLAAVSGLMAASMIARLVRLGGSMSAGGSGRAARAPRHVRPGRRAAGRNRRRH